MEAGPFEGIVAAYTASLKKTFESDARNTLQNAIKAMIFNVTSLACIVTLLNGRKTVEVEDLDGVRRYLSQHCAPMKRTVHQQRTTSGGSFPSDYFGFIHPAYDGTKDTGFVSINFADGVAREALGPTIAGGAMTPKVAIYDLIKSVCDHHKLSISRDAIIQLIKIMDVHMACLTKDIGRTQKVSNTRINQILSHKRHSIFH